MSEHLISISPAIVSSAALVVISSTFHSLQKAKRHIFFQTLLHQSLFLILLIMNDYFFYNASVIEIFVYSNIFSALIAFAFLIKELSVFPKTKKKTSGEFGFFKIVRISAPMMVSTSSLMIMSWTDVLMIGMYMTEADVGIYGAANRMALLISMPLLSFKLLLLLFLA